MKSFLNTLGVFLFVALLGTGQAPVPVTKVLTATEKKDSIIVQIVPAYEKTLEQREELKDLKNQVYQLTKNQVKNEKKVDSISVQVDVKAVNKQLDKIQLNDAQ